MIELSVVIPNRNSPFTSKTIQDCLDKAGCEVEVIVNVDENWPEPLIEDARVHYIHPASPIGLRQGVNNCVAMARGKYIMKIDDHCAVGDNYGRILIDNHKEDNWIQIPRRYALDAENWKIEEQNNDKYPIDYYFLDFPRKGKDHDWGIHGVEWRERREQRNSSEFDVDETMSMQGSCYFMTRDHYLNFLGGMDTTKWGVFAQESQEIGFKTWLGGGKLMTNKKTWYAHLHKGGRYGRMYKMPSGNVEMSNKSAYYWMQNMWKRQIHDMKWLIDRFWPVPHWPDNWQEVWNQQVKEGWPNIYEENQIKTW